MMKISLFIPTFNAIATCGNRFADNLRIISDAGLHRVLVIDSSSTDKTQELVSQFGFDLHIIPSVEFDHGGTRELALEMLEDCDVIVYLTQDVLLQNVESLTKLVDIFLNDRQVGGCYGRQLPHSDADLFARHLRSINYTENSYVRSYQDRYVHGFRSTFSSDSFAAYRVDVLRNIGGFPDRVIFGEDVIVFARMLQAAYKVAYVADAICYHSHNYRIWDDFKRYFDIGVFHRSQNWILQDFGNANRSGVRFMLSEFAYLLKHNPLLLPKSIAKIMAKYIGYKLGSNYDTIGVDLCRKFTTNKAFWR